MLRRSWALAYAAANLTSPTVRFGTGMKQITFTRRNTRTGGGIVALGEKQDWCVALLGQGDGAVLAGTLVGTVQAEDRTDRPRLVRGGPHKQDRGGYQEQGQAQADRNSQPTPPAMARAKGAFFSSLRDVDASSLFESFGRRNAGAAAHLLPLEAIRAAAAGQRLGCARPVADGQGQDPPRAALPGRRTSARVSPGAPAHFPITLTRGPSGSADTFGLDLAGCRYGCLGRLDLGPPLRFFVKRALPSSSEKHHNVSISGGKWTPPPRPVKSTAPYSGPRVPQGQVRQALAQEALAAVYQLPAGRLTR